MDNISSQRNKEKFSHEGFLYIFDKKSSDGNRKMWRCERKDCSCRARIHTDAVTGDVPKNRLLGSFHNIDCVIKGIQRTQFRDELSSQNMVSVMFQYYGTEFANNYEQR